jgi:hypothetical protein
MISRMPSQPRKHKHHPWYKHIHELSKNFSAKEIGYFDRETAADIRAGWDPETAEVRSYGVVIIARNDRKTAQQLVYEVVNRLESR